MKSKSSLKACPIKLGDRVLLVDLVVLNIHDFDVIFRMDWLSQNHANIYCHEKMVVFQPRMNQFLILLEFELGLAFQLSLQ